MIRTITLAAVAAALTLAGCTSAADEPTESAPVERSEPVTKAEPAPEPEPVDEYADIDPSVRDLYEACDDGDMLACDDLYLAADLGSVEERFGDTCGDRRDDLGEWCSPESAGPVTTDEDEFATTLLVAFALIDQSTMDDACALVEATSARMYAVTFEQYYSPEITNGLPYNLDGAERAFEAWCS